MAAASAARQDPGGAAAAVYPGAAGGRAAGAAGARWPPWRSLSDTESLYSADFAPPPTSRSIRGSPSLHAVLLEAREPPLLHRPAIPERTHPWLRAPELRGDSLSKPLAGHAAPGGRPGQRASLLTAPSAASKRPEEGGRRAAPCSGELALQEGAWGDFRPARRCWSLPSSSTASSTWTARAVPSRTSIAWWCLRAPPATTPEPQVPQPAESCSRRIRAQSGAPSPAALR